LYASTDESLVTRSVSEAELLAADIVICGLNRTRKQLNRFIRELRGFAEPLPVPGARLVCLRNDWERGFLNGSLWDVDRVDFSGENVVLALSGDMGASTAVVPVGCFLDPEPTPIPWGKNSFDFGYALTCHKSQGSEWRSVLIIDESSVFEENRYRWLYTALTRASERVTLAWRVRT
jgi:exodeoxyribonuclease-5